MNQTFSQYSLYIGTDVKYGPGVHEQIGPIAKDLGAKKAMLITDLTLVKINLSEKVVLKLKEQGIEADIFDEIETEPTDKHVHSGVSFLKKSTPDLLVALGGGSVMDCAKCINMMAYNPGHITDYEGESSNFPNDSPLPLIALPTTSGTGAELAAWSVITDTSRSYKMSFGSPFLLPDYALVDPVLTLDLPPKPTAYSGFDALSQVIEGMLSRRRSPISHQLGLYAIKLISENIGTATQRGWDLQARSNMALSSLLGGINMILGGCIIVHSIAETIGGLYHLPHGLTVGLVLPHMLTFNLAGDVQLYAEIAGALGANISDMSIREAADQVVPLINKMLNDLEFPTFSDVGLKEEDIPKIARLSFTNPNTADNPRTLTIEDFEAILRGCLADERGKR